jgi:hypothetical protein
MQKQPSTGKKCRLAPKLTLVLLILASLACQGLPAGNETPATESDNRESTELDEQTSTGMNEGSNDQTNHFENDEISFDYPGDWQTLSWFWPEYQPGHNEYLDADQLIGVADPASSTPWEKYTTSVSVERKEMPAGSSLQDVFEQAYQNIDQAVAISEGTAVVDGVTAYERVYKLPHGEPWFQIRDLWLEQGGTIYIISCWALPSHFDEAQADFDIITASFHVK